MCSVSVIQDYMRQRVAPMDWTRPVWTEYQEVLRRLEALDAKLGQPHCEDPAKAAWMAAVEERLKKLESGSTPQGAK
jgi:hypothetical protein